MQHGDREARRLALSELAGGYKASVAVLTAVELGLFQRLASGAAKADDLAQELDLEPAGLRYVLDALVGLDLLARSDAGYELHGPALEFLHPESDAYMGDILAHNYHTMQRWVRLAEQLRGEVVKPQKGRERSTAELRAFIMGMQNISRQSAEEVADGLDLRGVKSILDLGGGPGTYLYSFLNRLPEARGALLDLPPVVEIAREEPQREGMLERVNFLEGSMFDVDYSGPYDLVFLGNIIHSWGREQNRELMARIASSLSEGGRLVVKDFFLDESRTLPPDAALFSLNMYVGTSEGRSYGEDEVRGWLADAGLNVVSRYRVGTHSGVLVAAK